MEQRNRGVDLLRMVAMWMVVILHILNKGGALGASAPLSAGRETALLLDMAAYCAVDCYGMISGYVGAGHRFRYSGAVALWLRTAFYTLLITAAFTVFLPGSVNGDRVLRAFFPVLFRQYWYVTAYFGMCLFIPFFNLLLERLTRRQAKGSGAVPCADLFHFAHPAARGRIPDGQRLQRPVAVLPVSAGRHPASARQVCPETGPLGGGLRALRAGDLACQAGGRPAVDVPDRPAL